MKRYVCSVCGYIYEEAKGNPEAGIAAGTRWEALHDSWVCPLCGATKPEFALMGEPAAVGQPAAVVTEPRAELPPLSAAEMSALCTNLARGCEKQYLPNEAALFAQLGAYFQAATPAPQSTTDEALLLMIQADLEKGIPAAANAAKAAEDRGAQRALVWGDKVTRIAKSLLARYAREGETMTETANVYVCGICGFVFIGDEPPALCPVCKVPAWKFEKVEGR